MADVESWLSLLGMREPLVRYIMRRGVQEEKNITAIVTKIRNLDAHYMLKSFANELETSLAMEKAIDAGAVASFVVRHGKRIRRPVDDRYSKKDPCSRTLHQRRIAFVATRRD